MVCYEGNKVADRNIQHAELKMPKAGTWEKGFSYS